VAKRSARPVRPRVRLAGGLAAVVALTATALTVPQLASAAPQPSVSSVQRQLGQLAYENTQLVEKFDQAQTAVTRRSAQAQRAAAAARAADAAYEQAREQFVQLIQAQYEGESFGAAGALLDSSNGENYLDRLTELDLISTHNAQIVRGVTHARAAAAASSVAAKRLLVSAKHDRDALAAKKAAVRKQINRYRILLASLTAQQQAAYHRASDPAVNVTKMHLTAAGTGAARKAVQFALDQVGKPYVFGAAGPGAYDCSGLTMTAWQHAGVSLPHSAAEQYNYGHHVSRDQLQPGDLIFFYQPIGHVTIYIGGGMMVSAPTEGEPVQVVALSRFNSDYVGATRLT
jgi:peptidoglycan DL-endopeptidase CwlO